MTTLKEAPASSTNGSFEDYVERGLAHLWVHTQQYNDLIKPDGFKVFTHGEGVWLWDATGR